MKRILLIALCCIIGFVQAEENYLDYHMPSDADVYGPTGTRDVEETYSKFYRKGSDPQDGKALVGVEYYRSGILIKRLLYKNGLLHGIQKEWYINGGLKTKEPYRHGVRHGEFKHWNRMGQLIGKYNMSNGKGKKLVFSSDGIIEEFEEYNGNKCNGWSVSFHDNGKVRIVNKIIDDECNYAYSNCFHSDGSIYFVTYTDGLHPSNGIIAYYSNDGDNIDLKYFLENNFVVRDEYQKHYSDNKKIPKLSDDAAEYKKYIKGDVVSLVARFEKSERVKIPLEFSADGSIMTASGKVFTYPE